MPTVPLPPWLRKIQQSWYWQFLGLPLLVGFGGSMVTMGCLKDGIQNVAPACFWGAVNTTIISFFTVLISGHSPGSASFEPNGTTNTPVENLVTIQKAADTTRPEMKDVVTHVEQQVAMAANVAKN